MIIVSFRHVVSGLGDYLSFLTLILGICKSHGFYYVHANSGISARCGHHDIDNLFGLFNLTTYKADIAGFPVKTLSFHELIGLCVSDEISSIFRSTDQHVILVTNNPKTDYNLDLAVTSRYQTYSRKILRDAISESPVVMHANSRKALFEGKRHICIHVRRGDVAIVDLGLFRRNLEILLRRPMSMPNGYFNTQSGRILTGQDFKAEHITRCRPVDVYLSKIMELPSSLDPRKTIITVISDGYVESRRSIMSAMPSMGSIPEKIVEAALSMELTPVISLSSYSVIGSSAEQLEESIAFVCAADTIVSSRSCFPMQVRRHILGVDSSCEHIVV